MGLALVRYALAARRARRAGARPLIARYGDTMAYQIAIVCSERGDVDEAFGWLERAYGTRDPGTDVRDRSIVRPAARRSALGRVPAQDEARLAELADDRERRLAHRAARAEPAGERDDAARRRTDAVEPHQRARAKRDLGTRDRRAHSRSPSRPPPRAIRRARRAARNSATCAR